MTLPSASCSGLCFIPLGFHTGLNPRGDLGCSYCFMVSALEFLLYLTSIGREIIEIVKSLNYSIKQNSAICRNVEIFGYTPPDEFVVCLNNIKNKVSPVKFYVNETVYHEAVHVIQSCKGNALGIPTSLSKYKNTDVINSVKISGGNSAYEREAYFLEDKPTEVLKFLKKYCL